LVIDGTRPIELSPTDICQRWFEWRLGRLEIKFTHELDLKEGRLEIVRGFLKAIDKIDEVIKIIRGSASAKEALTTLVTNRTLKFTGDQARAILEMKLRQLTGLDRDELLAEEGVLITEVAELTTLVKDKNARTEWALKLADELATRHGEKRRSALIESPAGFTKVTTPGGTQRDQTPRAAKPKFLKIDTKRGIIEQTKIVKGSMVVERTDKLIVLGENGIFKKLPSSFKGGVFDTTVPLVLAKKETDVAPKKFLVVFKLDEALKVMVLSGIDLAKTTSSGKRWLPEGAELVHFGEGSYKVEFASARKKPVVLDLSAKAGKPGGKGIKIAALTDLAN
jgi:DNA gyrase/topoisomerase IV subunit A